MSFVTFKHRRTIPENFIQGTFYWIDKDDETSELWFGSRNGLIRLDNYFDRSEIEDIINYIYQNNIPFDEVLIASSETNDYGFYFSICFRLYLVFDLFIRF